MLFSHFKQVAKKLYYGQSKDFHFTFWETFEVRPYFGWVNHSPEFQNLRNFFAESIQTDLFFSRASGWRPNIGYREQHFETKNRREIDEAKKADGGSQSHLDAFLRLCSNSRISFQMWSTYHVTAMSSSSEDIGFKIRGSYVLYCYLVTVSIEVL